MLTSKHITQSLWESSPEIEWEHVVTHLLSLESDMACKSFSKHTHTDFTHSADKQLFDVGVLVHHAGYGMNRSICKTLFKDMVITQA